MTPADFVRARATLRWSRIELGRALAINEKQIRRWEAGESPIPAPVAEWIGAAAAWLRAHPPPVHPFDGGKPQASPTQTGKRGRGAA